ncbi:MAG TPA: DUF5819 family protein [bacterium]|nr:DUF5819 family protein [bacterium]
MISRIRVWAANGLRVTLLAWLVFHFALTGVYVLYNNPVRRALAPILNAYIDKYFAQGWGLFAPDPMSDNLSLMIRPLTPAESAAVGRLGVPKTGWYDLTRALWEHRQRMPFSYDEALGHFHIVEMVDYLDGDPASFRYLYPCREEGAKACEAAKAAHVQARQQAILYLWRLGSEFVNARFPAPKYNAMALKIHDQFATPWPDRGSGRREVRDTLIGVYAADPTRSPMPVPAVEVR